MAIYNNTHLDTLSVIFIVGICIRLGEVQSFKPHHRPQLPGNDITEMEVINRYVSLQLYHSLGLPNRHTTSAIHLHGTVINTLHQMWFDTARVLEACSRQHACLCFHSQCDQLHTKDTIIPCGSICESSQESLESIREIGVPFGLRLNITLLHMMGHAYTRECFVTESLTLTELSEEGAEGTEHVLCGKSPIQNFYSTTSRVRVTWSSNLAQREASFCLIYEAISVDHVILLEKANMKDMSPVKVCRRYPGRNCMYPKRLLLQLYEVQNNLFNALGPSHLFVQGDTWVYTWSFSGNVLKTPTVEIKSFRCNFLRSQKYTNNPVNRLKVTDGPFSGRDPYFFSGLFAILSIQRCGQRLKEKNFTSSIGDITVQAIWNSWQKFRVIINFSLLLDLPCPSVDFCSLEKREISTQEPISIFSTNHSSQARFLISINQETNGFIELRDMVFRYDGLGHLFCATGGIFIFELEPMSLVTKICTLWTADIWSKSEKTQGVNSLYFNDKPVLIVIKSYKNAGWGYVMGSVQMSRYPGFQNLIFRAKFNARYQYDLSRWYVVDRQVHIKHLALVNNSESHLILQESVLDEDESWHSNWKYGIFASTKLNIDSMSMVTITGCFDLSGNVSVNHRKHQGKASRVGFRLYSFGRLYIHSTLIDTLTLAENRSCFSFHQAFTDPDWSVLIDTVSFLFGLKLTVFVERIDPSDFDCSSSMLTGQEMLRFNGEMPAFIPSLPCGTMRFPQKQTFKLYYGVLSKPYSTADCCYMKLWAKVPNTFYYVVLESIGVAEGYVSERLNTKLKTYRWIPSQSNGTLRRNKADIDTLEIHFTGKITVVTFSFELEIRGFGNRNSIRDVLNLAFRHFYLSEPTKPWSYQQRQSPRRGETCVDVVESCYKTFWFGTSDCGNAIKACTAIGMHMLTLNTEIEWTFIQSWYQDYLLASEYLSQTQLFFLGIEILSVSINIDVLEPYICSVQQKCCSYETIYCISRNCFLLILNLRIQCSCFEQRTIIW